MTRPPWTRKSKTTLNLAAHRPDRTHGAIDQRGAGDPSATRELVGHRCGAESTLGSGRGGGRVDVERHVGVEQPEQGGQVASPGRGEEGVDHRTLGGHVALGLLFCAAYAPTGPAGQLTGGGRGRAYDRCDLVERHPEEVVEDEGDPLAGLEPVEHDEQRDANGVGEDRLLGRVRCAGGGRRDRIPGVVRELRQVFAPGRPRTEHVETDPGDHRREPAVEVGDLAGVAAVQAQPGLLDGVLGLLG